jgi:hypothetical protein
LPPDQSALEAKYREELAAKFGIVFSSLFTLSNMPIKRFADFLHRRGELDKYMELLVRNFNAATVPGLMCTNLVSVVSLIVFVLICLFFFLLLMAFIVFFLGAFCNAYLWSSPRDHHAVLPLVSCNSPTPVRARAECDQSKGACMCVLLHQIWNEPLRILLS